MGMVSLLAVIFAGVSAIGAWHAAQLTAKASEFQSGSTYIKYDAPPEMYKSLEALSEIQGRNLPAFQHSRTPENNDYWQPSFSVDSTIPASPPHIVLVEPFRQQPCQFAVTLIK